MKKCTKCKVEKELTEFGKRKTTKDGLECACKSCKKEYDKEHYQSNKKHIKERIKEYYQANKEHHKEYNKEHYQANKERIKEQRKEYYQANKERINKLRRDRKKVHPLFKMKVNLGTRTSIAFKNKGYNKNTKTQEMLGVNWEVCKAHTERQFAKGMSWSNYGEWHIDHIIPLSYANTEEELKKLCHYSNLQPLWAVDNLIKSDKINGQQTSLRI